MIILMIVSDYLLCSALVYRLHDTSNGRTSHWHVKTRNKVKNKSLLILRSLFLTFFLLPSCRKHFGDLRLDKKRYLFSTLIELDKEVVGVAVCYVVHKDTGKS